MEQYRWYI